MAKKKAARQSSGWLALAIGSITLQASGGAAVTVLSEVIKAIIDHVGDKEFEDKVTSGLAATNNQLRDLRIQIGKIPLREYDQHMATGRRHLQDVLETQTHQDRQQTIQAAKAKFIEASAVAQVQGDLERRLLAEVAIAGCWYALDSQEGLNKTLQAARVAAETGVLDGDRAIIVRYGHILRLCRNLDIVPGHWVEPLDPQLIPAIKATIPAHAVVGTSAYLLGVQVLVTATSPGVVSFEVWNERWPEVQVGLAARSANPAYYPTPVAQGTALAYTMHNLDPQPVVIVRLPGRPTQPTLGFLVPEVQTLPPSPYPGYPTSYPSYYYCNDCNGFHLSG